MIQRRNSYRYAVPTVAPARLARRVLPRRAAPSRAENRLALAAGSLSLLVYLSAGLLLALVYGYFAFFDAILPGVTVAGAALGGQTPARAAETLARTWQDGTPVALTDGQRAWQVSPARLGFALDAAASVERTVRAGRDESGWPRLSALLGLEGGLVVPVVKFDPAAARAGLQAAAAQVNTSPVEASLVFENGRWSALPGRTGALIDLDATLAAWIADPAALLAGGRLPLAMRAVAPRLLDAAPLVAQLEAQMQAGLQIRLYDPITDERIDWRVDPSTLAGWLRVEPAGDMPRIVLDRAGLEGYLQSRQSELGGRAIGELRGLDDLTRAWQEGRPVIALLRHPATSYTVQPGEQLIGISMKVGIPYWMIVQANPGLDPDSLTPGQVIALPSPDDLLPLPVVPGKRIVISISQQRLWAYENGSLRSESVISTGIPRSPTLPGIFQVRSHELNAYASLWDLWMPHFMGIYEAAPGFMNGIHGLPLLSGGRRLWADALGRPASYGCIIMTLDEAEDLYQWAEEGTVVEIQP